MHNGYLHSILNQFTQTFLTSSIGSNNQFIREWSDNIGITDEWRIRILVIYAQLYRVLCVSTKICQGPSNHCPVLVC